MKVFTILDEALNLAHSSGAVAMTSVGSHASLQLAVRRDMAAVQVFASKLRAAAMQAPVGHSEDSELCVGCEASVQQAIVAGIVDELAPSHEAAFRQHLVRTLRRRANLEDWQSRKGSENKRKTVDPTASAAHIFILRPNATQVRVLAKQLARSGVSSGLSKPDSKAMLRFVGAHPLLLLMRSPVEPDAKTLSVSVLSAVFQTSVPPSPPRLLH